MGWGWLAAATIARLYLCFVLALAACALLPMVTGLNGSVVQSGSMQPSINPGDVVLSRTLSQDEELPLGRVITFPAPAGSAKTGIVLHRLVAVNDDGSLVTRGDANAQTDSAPLARADIIARACVLVPWIGLPAYWLTHGSFLPLAIWILLTIGALAIERMGILAPPRHKHRLQPSSGRVAAKPAVSRTPVAQSAVRLSRAGAGRAAIILAIVTGSVLAAPSFGEAEAGFTSQTTSVGNTWSVAAAAPAVRLAFATTPSGATGGIPFAAQPVVAFKDASGKTTTIGGAVTLEITSPSGATLTCATNPLVAVSGIASFAGCAIDKVGTYTLTARSGALTAAVSTPLVITRGPAARLGFATSPSANTTANVSFAAQPAVAIQDAGGNTITTSSAAVSLSITTPAGATLACTTNPRNASSGVAVFSGCKINKTGTYTLTAASGSLAAGVSASFTIVAGSAAKLVFTTSPSSSVSTTVFAAQPVVAVQDSLGNTVTTSSAAVSLSITTPAGATLACTTNPRNASSGIAAFSGCKIDKAGTYTLTATSGSLASATSASFTITVGAASKLVFTTSPSSSVSTTVFAAQPVVTVQDAGGNTVTTSSAAVTLSITTPAGATLACMTNPRGASSGIAAFSGCKIDKAGTYTLTATSGSLASATSASFTITVGAASKLVFTTSPSSSAPNTAFATQPVVTVQDAGGNTVTTSNASISLFVTGGPGGVNLTCTANPKSAASGVAAYSGCRINQPGTYTLTAFAGPLSPGTSASFTIGG